jgi:hypothetical protein
LTGIPCYVGQGNKDRPFKHIKRALRGQHTNLHLARIIRGTKGKLPVCVIRTGLTRKEAVEMEMALIKVIGREDLGTGPLVNRTDGGEGPTNMIFSKSARKKISQAGLGNQYAVGGSKDPEVRRKADAIRSKASLEMWADKKRRAEIVTAQKAFWTPAKRKAQGKRISEWVRAAKLRKALELLTT